MSNSLEDRLERAGRTLDAASADHAAGTGPLGDVPAVSGVGQPRPAWRLAGVAALIAAVVVGGAVAATRGSTTVTEPADGSRDHRQEIATAIARTRAAPAMTVVVHGDWPNGSRFPHANWNYGAPDRWEQLAPTYPGSIDIKPPTSVSVRLYIGAETWAAVDGRWEPEQPPHPADPVPIEMLDRIPALECTGMQQSIDDSDNRIEFLIAWTPPSGGCRTDDAGVPVDLPVGTEVWLLDLDDAGRIEQVDAGVVVEVDVSALGGFRSHFWYDDIPEVSERPAD